MIYTTIRFLIFLYLFSFIVIPSQYSLDGFIYDPKPEPDYTVVYRVILALLIAVSIMAILTLGFFLFNRKLKEAVKQRTQELFKANKELEQHKGNLETLVEHRTKALKAESDQHKQTAEMLKLDESRLEAMLKLTQMVKSNNKEINDFCLEEAIRLTNSRIGYLAFLNDDETILSMYSWSKEAMKQCGISDKKFDYKVFETGLWGEAVRKRKPIITNDYQSSTSLKKGYPKGHIEIVRHMNIPVFADDRIVAVAGVGNKEGNYDDSDIRQLTLLMNYMWWLNQRKNKEDERKRLILDLQNALSEIKKLQGIIPICSKCKKIRDDKGYWNQIESYIQRHSEAEFSHSMCPDCSDKLYGNEDWYIEMKKENN